MAQSASALVALLAGCTAALPSLLAPRDLLDCTSEGGSVNDPNCPTFYWGTIGDSYASGVAYSDDTTYDGNANGCMRYNQAYTAQLIDDVSWTVGQQGPVFNGCSGARLVDMHGNGESGLQLIHEITPLSTVVFMQAGGNNCNEYGSGIACNFAAIAEACLYWPWFLTHDYGDPYDIDEDCSGDCCKALKGAENYIDDLEGGLSFDLKATLDDLFGTEQFASESEQWLYLLGYVHFFNDQTTGDGTCEYWEWSLKKGIGFGGPRVTQVLRQRMNSLLTDFNSRYQAVVSAYQAPANKHLTYVSITEAFNGHRFCEAGASELDQIGGSDVWIWNLSYFAGEGEVQITASNEDLAPTSPETGSISDPEGDVSANQELADGWKLRTMHPKGDGYFNIKRVLLAQMRADNVPGVTGEDPISCNLGNYPSPTNGPIRDGINYLNGQTIHTSYGQTGQLISCSYGTGIFLSVDSNGRSDPFDMPGFQPGSAVREAFKYCGGSSSSKNSDTFPAFQYWAEGYNVLVTGGQDC